MFQAWGLEVTQKRSVSETTLCITGEFTHGNRCISELIGT